MARRATASQKQMALLDRHHGVVDGCRPLRERPPPTGCASTGPSVGEPAQRNRPSSPSLHPPIPATSRCLPPEPLVDQRCVREIVECSGGLNILRTSCGANESVARRRRRAFRVKVRSWCRSGGYRDAVRLGDGYAVAPCAFTPRDQRPLRLRTGSCLDLLPSNAAPPRAPRRRTLLRRSLLAPAKLAQLPPLDIGRRIDVETSHEPNLTDVVRPISGALDLLT
jgi:hypothetical protein